MTHSTNVPKRDIWNEVGATLIVRGTWAAFFLGMGALVHDVEKTALNFTLILAAIVVGVTTVVWVEYRRAKYRLRRVYVSPSMPWHPEVCQVHLGGRCNCSVGEAIRGFRRNGTGGVA